MELNSLTSIGGLAFLAPIVLFFQQTRHFVVRIFNIFIKERTINQDFDKQLIYTTLRDKSKVLTLDDYRLSCSYYWVHKEKMDLPIYFRLNNFEIFLYRGFIPIFIFGVPEGFKIRYLKFTFNFEKLLKEVSIYQNGNIKQLKNYQADRFRIEKRFGSFRKNMFSKAGVATTNPSEAPKGNGIASDYNPIMHMWAIQSYGLDKNVINYKTSEFGFFEQNLPKNKYQFTKKGLEILQEVESWYNSRQWYEERNINWRRSSLLFGKTGVGKSALILEIAKKLKLPVYVLDIASMNNEEFQKNLEEINHETAFLLFEDFDILYNKRENLTWSENAGGLTFDCFLNQLSGVNSIKNKFVFITTNYLEKMDKALLRPGRIDSIVELPSLNMEEKRKLAEIFLDKAELVENVLLEGKEDSTAEFENRCTAAALKDYWDNKKSAKLV